MITIEEDQRISWDDLFLHHLVNNNSLLYTTFVVCDAYVSNALNNISTNKDN